MKPSDYLAKYHDILAWGDDYSLTWVKIRKYVSGCKGDPWEARTPIIQGLIKENKGSNWNSTQFTVDGYTILMMSIVRVYCGKGSPQEINDALWLAHRYGKILNHANKKPHAKSLQQYADAYVGMDCNGYVGNFFGINPSTSIDTYALTRRKSVSEIQENDVCVWYRPWKSSKKYGHIGLINTIETRTESGFKFELCDWGVAEQEKHQKTLTVNLKKDTDGKIDGKGIKNALYFDSKEKDGTAHVFICPPPNPPKPKD